MLPKVDQGHRHNDPTNSRISPKINYHVDGVTQNRDMISLHGGFALDQTLQVNAKSDVA